MKPKVVVIVGPTASGKTSLAIKLAKQFTGEVISADSRQVYKSINLCSGKVTPEEMSGIPHHLLDVADPMTVYTVSDFKRDATQTITDIISRHRLPIIAGGTFLYTDTLLGRISIPQVKPDTVLRTRLETMNTEALVETLAQLDPARAAMIDKANPRRLVRAIEVATSLGLVPLSQTTEPYEALMLGIEINQETLHHNIHLRIEERLKAGMVAEVKTLLDSGVTPQRLESLGLECRYLSRFLRGSMSYEEALVELEVKTKQFAKRQKTWLKRDQSIHWVTKDDQLTITGLVSKFLLTQND